MNRFSSQFLALAAIFSMAFFTGIAVAEESASLADELHKHPVIVHRKGHAPYLTVDAKLVTAGQTGVLVYLVEPISGPSRYDWVPLSQIEHFSVYSSIDDAISGYKQTDEIKSHARERFQNRWSMKPDTSTPSTNGG